MRTPAGGPKQGEEDPRVRPAIRGAFLGFFVDLFDIYLPIVALAPAIIYFVSPGLGTTGTALVGGSIFAATLVGRPLGALIFGHFADTIGRKRTAVVAMNGAGAATLLIALLPGYQQWGVAAVALFIALRLIAGVFLGGEYTAANPLAMEYSPREKRGLYSAIIDAGFPLAYASISLMTLALLLLLPSEGLNSPYVQWGWRIPFVFGAVLAFGLAAYYGRTVSESEVFERSEGSEAPLKRLFSGENFKNVLQVFVIMSGFWLSLQAIAAVLPGVLGREESGLSDTGLTLVLVIAYVVVAGVYLPAGVLSQRIGRRPFLIASGLVMAVFATFFYYLLIRLAPENFFVVLVLTTTIVVIGILPWALTPAYVNERFRTDVRASGYGFSYSIAVILPSFYSYYQAGLATFMPFEYTTLVLLAVGALLISIGAAWGPETKDVEMGGKDDARRTPARGRSPDEAL